MKEEIENIIEDCLQGDINPENKKLLTNELIKYINLQVESGIEADGIASMDKR